MRANCHIHALFDGVDWKASIARGVCDEHLHTMLRTYQEKGFVYLRDGGDRFSVSRRARELAAHYGIRYRTPLSPLCKAGCYGAFIGTEWQDLSHYARLVKQQKENGADFMKIMISGIMDFSEYGKLTQDGLSPWEIRQLVSIAHDLGLSVMAHCNGAKTAIAAAEAGVDSVEHGAYLNEEALCAMAERNTIWCPTVSTVGNLLGKGRYPDAEVGKILDSFLENIARYKGYLAPGDDAGAWAVPHGCDTEELWLSKAGISESRLQEGIAQVVARF